MAAVDGRDKTGRFQAGQSGNPSGRPRGSRNRTTQLLDDLADGEGDVIVAKLVELARGGFWPALKLLVDRLARRDRRVHVELRRVGDAADVSGAIADVVALAAGGDLSIEEAQGLLRLIEHQRKAIETSELADRLRVIEEHQKESGNWD